MHQTYFDIMFNLSDNALLEEFIKRMISRAKINLNSKFAPSAVVKKIFIKNY